MVSGPVRVNRSVTFSLSDAPRYGHRIDACASCVGMNVGRLDDERIAFPTADRIAKPRLDLRRHVSGRAEADDAHVVHHLGHDHHVVLRLHDGVVVVVEVVRQHRRAGVRPE